MTQQPSSRELLIQEALRNAAIAAGIIDVQCAMAADPAGCWIDPDGEVRGAHLAIDALRVARPYWFVNWSRFTHEDMIAGARSE